MADIQELQGSLQKRIDAIGPHVKHDLEKGLNTSERGSAAKMIGRLVGEAIILSNALREAGELEEARAVKAIAETYWKKLNELGKRGENDQAENATDQVPSPEEIFTHYIKNTGKYAPDFTIDENGHNPHGFTRETALDDFSFVLDVVARAAVTAVNETEAPAQEKREDVVKAIQNQEIIFGTNLPAMAPLRIQAFSSASVTSSPPRYFSMTASSISTAVSIIFSRYSAACSLYSSGMSV